MNEFEGHKRDGTSSFGAGRRWFLRDGGKIEIVQNPSIVTALVVHKVIDADVSVMDPELPEVVVT